jgi:hypothetical protein
MDVSPGPERRGDAQSNRRDRDCKGRARGAKRIFSIYGGLQLRVWCGAICLIALSVALSD